MADNVSFQAATLASPPSATQVATDDVGGAHYQRFKPDVGGDGVSKPLVNTRRGSMPVEESFADPKTKYVQTGSNIAPAGTADHDSDQISSAKTGRLVLVLVCCPMPFLAEFKTVSNGTPTTRAAACFAMGNTWELRPPSRDFFSVAHDATSGFDGFRVTVTSLEMQGGVSAPARVTFLYDEE